MHEGQSEIESKEITQLKKLRIKLLTLCRSFLSQIVLLIKVN